MSKRSRRNKQQNKALAPDTALLPAAKSYIATDILGSGSGYGGVFSSKSDIRPNKFGAAFVVLCNIAAQRCIDARMGEVGAANWSIKVKAKDPATGKPKDEIIASNLDYENNTFASAIVGYQQKYSEPLFARWEQALCVAGENYIELVRNDFGFATELEWLNPLAVDIDAPLNRIRAFRYHGEGAFITLAPHQVAYDRNPSNMFTDVYGHSPLMTATGTAGVVINSGRMLSAYFRNDAKPGAIARPKPEGGKTSWNEDEVKLIRQVVAENHKGVDNAFRMALFPFPIDIEIFDQPDLQKIAELIKTLESEIYTAFGTPRSIAGDSDTARYQSSPMDEPKFMRLIARQLSRIQDSANTAIAPAFKDGKWKYYLEFDLSDYEVIPPETVTTANSMLLAGGITLNAYKRMVGEDEIDNGNVYYLPAGVVVVPEEQLAIIQPKPTYLPFGNPQGTIEQATEMAQSVGINTPNAPIPTQPAPNLTTEEIDPNAQSAQDLQQQAPTAPLDPTKDAGEPLFVGLSLANDSSLIGLQRRLMEVYPGEGVRWNTPADYHITVLYADATDEANAQAFCEALKELPLPDLALRIGQLNSFDNLGEHAVHLRIRQNAALKEYQAAVYDLAEEYEISCSPYSSPAQWTPHITMCYLPEKVGRTTFDSKLTVTPKGVMCSYGESTLWESWTDDTEPPDDEPTPPDNTEAAKAEFKAWLKYHKNNAGKANKRPFTFEHVPTDIADTVVKCIALGESAESVYNRLVHVVAGDMPAELPEPTQAYKTVLAEFGITDDNAIKAHAHGVLLAKAITDTRARFEAELTRQMLRAYNEKVKRSTFERNMGILLNKYAEKALYDGFADAGYEDFDIDDTEDDEAVDARRWLDGFLDDQAAYISNVADVLYADDAISEQEVRDSKGELWFTGSVQPAYNYALTTASKNARLKWVFDPAKEHCRSCETLNGIVLTAKRWQSEAIEPGSRELDCWGGHCGCRFEPTKEKKFRGKLPRWKFKALLEHAHSHA